MPSHTLTAQQRDAAEAVRYFRPEGINVPGPSEARRRWYRLVDVMARGVDVSPTRSNEWAAWLAACEA